MEKVLRINEVVHGIREVLRCYCCGELLENPYRIDSCNHSFCFECVRTVLEENSKCPACNLPAIPKDLVQNKQLRNMLAAFLRLEGEAARLLKGLESAGKDERSSGQRQKKKRRMKWKQLKLSQESIASGQRDEDDGSQTTSPSSGELSQSKEREELASFFREQFLDGCIKKATEMKWERNPTRKATESTSVAEKDAVDLRNPGLSEGNIDKENMRPAKKIKVTSEKPESGNETRFHKTFDEAENKAFDMEEIQTKSLASKECAKDAVQNPSLDVQEEGLNSPGELNPLSPAQSTQSKDTPAEDWTFSEFPTLSQMWPTTKSKKVPEKAQTALAMDLVKSDYQTGQEALLDPQPPNELHRSKSETLEDVKTKNDLAETREEAKTRHTETSSGKGKALVVNEEDEEPASKAKRQHAVTDENDLIAISDTEPPRAVESPTQEPAKPIETNIHSADEDGMVVGTQSPGEETCAPDEVIQDFSQSESSRGCVASDTKAVKELVSRTQDGPSLTKYTIDHLSNRSVSSEATMELLEEDSHHSPSHPNCQVEETVIPFKWLVPKAVGSAKEQIAAVTQNFCAMNDSAVVLAFTNIRSKEEGANLRSLAEYMGAEIIENVEDMARVTHVVTAVSRKGFVVNRSFKYLVALSSMKYIVGEDWLKESAAAGTWMTEKRYEPVGTERAERKRKRLVFEGLLATFVGEFPRPEPPRQQLETLFTCAGGGLTPRVPFNEPSDALLVLDESNMEKRNVLDIHPSRAVISAESILEAALEPLKAPDFFPT